MVAVNEKLVHVLVSKLVDKFGMRGVHSRGQQCPYDPWWWPITPANIVENWDLTVQEGERILEKWNFTPNTLFFSLCDGKKCFGETLRGSVGAVTNCIFILGERPSFSRSVQRAERDLRQRKQSIQQYCPKGEDGYGPLAEFIGRRSRERSSTSI